MKINPLVSSCVFVSVTLQLDNAILQNITCTNSPYGLFIITSFLIHVSFFSSAPSSDSLVPIGVFWDIENCSVPRGKSALSLVQRIRDEFFTNHKEVEFMCVCDINKENRDVIHELILAQVSLSPKFKSNCKLQQYYP